MIAKNRTAVYHYFYSIQLSLPILFHASFVCSSAVIIIVHYYLPYLPTDVCCIAGYIYLLLTTTVLHSVT